MSGAVRVPGSRDTRLLVTTLVVSAGMLLILAAFRFPDKAAAPEAPAAPAAPLERLAARATYVELARILAGLERQVAPGIVALRARTEQAGVAAPGRDGDVPAVRVGTERAVALVGADRSLDHFTSSPEVEGIVALDAPRGVALVKVFADSTPPAETAAPEALPAPGYAASVEVGPHGLGIRPFYYGRVDREPDARWGQTVLRFSAVQQTPPAGSAIFLLDGRFVGLGSSDGRGFVVIPANVLHGAVARLEAGGSIPLPDIGVDVQPLTGDLKAALSADAGVVVTHVLDDGPASGLLEPGDVVHRIDGRDIRTTEDYAAAIAGAGESLAVDARRRAEPVSGRIVPASRGTVADETSRQLGLDLRALRDVGAEVVRVMPRSAGARAGLVDGDVITLVDRVKAPAPAAIERAFRDAGPGRLIVGVQRGRRHLILVVATP